ncbi:MAG: hypothetical protein ACK559_24900, partial [bacterium]
VAFYLNRIQRKYTGEIRLDTKIQYFAWGIPSAIRYTRHIQNNPFNTIFNNLHTGICSLLLQILIQVVQIGA